MAEPETCPRCGTFAVLESNGFRRVCAPCIPLVRHPAELANGDPIKMLRALVQVLREVGPFTLVLSLASTAPLVAAQSLELGPRWLPNALQFATSSLVEAVVLLAFRARVLSSQPGAPIPWALALSRFPSVLGVNVVGAVLMALCMPAMLLYGPFMAAIALAALEQTRPIDAFVVAWKRSTGQRVALSVASLVPLVPELVLMIIPAVADGVVKARTGHHLLNPTRLAVLTMLVSATFSVPTVLFQIVAWLATRPQPQGVDAASS